MNGPLDLAHRIDIGNGIVSATVANSLKGKKGKRLKPTDFMPEWRHRAAMTAGQMATFLKSLTRRFGGTIRTPGEEG